MNTTVVNGLDARALENFANNVKQDPSKGALNFFVASQWQGGAKSVSKVKNYQLSGVEYSRDFTIEADEPTQLLGTNTAPNPQELLLAALNACMTVGFAANASIMGIELKKLEIKASGTLDLRGFLGLDDKVNPGYDNVNFEVIIDADAPQEKLEELYQKVLATSPNFHNFSRSIKMNSQLTVSSI